MSKKLMEAKKMKKDMQAEIDELRSGAGVGNLQQDDGALTAEIVALKEELAVVKLNSLPLKDETTVGMVKEAASLQKDVAEGEKRLEIAAIQAQASLTTNNNNNNNNNRTIYISHLID